MTGGFKQSRYSSDKFEEIAAAAKKDGEERKPRTSGEIRDLVRDPVVPLVNPPEAQYAADYYGPSK